VGARVRVTAHWSSFRDMSGRVTQVEPCVMVLLDGYIHPIRIDPVSLSELGE
jgi:hypothetical protein